MGNPKNMEQLVHNNSLQYTTLLCQPQGCGVVYSQQLPLMQKQLPPNNKQHLLSVTLVLMKIKIDQCTVSWTDKET